jgi:heme-degrading monooxygenase HmoA
MTKLGNTKVAALVVGALAVFGAGMLAGANTFGTPKSVLHIITVQWKSTATADQKTAAIDGVKKMAGEVPGIRNVWLKTLKVQPSEYSNVIVMEFEDEAAFKAYTANPAHKDWEKSYLPAREESRTHDVTN